MLPAYEGRLGFGDLRDAGNRAGLARWITGRKETRFHELGLDADSGAGIWSATEGTAWPRCW